jgi:NTP pyrophosphatase (non-canonical NTP hydrolase)
MDMLIVVGCQVMLEKNEIIIALSKRDIWEQLHQTQEECGEVIAAINRYRRKKTIKTMHDLQEEIADLIIMSSQCYLMLNKDTIDSLIKEKLSRCRQRITEGKL